jgi:hypothetical protein
MNTRYSAREGRFGLRRGSVGAHLGAAPAGARARPESGRCATAAARTVAHERMDWLGELISPAASPAEPGDTQQPRESAGRPARSWRGWW